MASGVILHHYPESPVSEKVRTVLGLKGLDWASVIIPRLPPKPDLMPLTGGYRLTPVMQIGANVYCDSLCIIDEIERRFPEPPLVPAAMAGLAWGLGGWTDGAFFSRAIALVLGDAGHDMPADFAADRGGLYFGPDFDLDAMIRDVPEARAQLRPQLGWLDAQLADGRPFMLGATPGLVDASCYYLVWFLRGRYSGGAAFLAQFPALGAWEERVRAIGHGAPADMDAAEALDIAARATPEVETAHDPEDALDHRLGDAVRVRADGQDGPAVRGEIAALDPRRVVIRRIDARVGEIALFFPRAGYRLEPA